LGVIVKRLGACLRVATHRVYQHGIFFYAPPRAAYPSRAGVCYMSTPRRAGPCGVWTYARWSFGGPQALPGLQEEIDLGRSGHDAHLAVDCRRRTGRGAGTPASVARRGAAPASLGDTGPATACLRGFPALKRTTRRAGMTAAAPVFGFRPMRDSASAAGPLSSSADTSAEVLSASRHETCNMPPPEGVLSLCRHEDPWMVAQRAWLWLA
jgi:hypothetical protein